MHREKRYNMLGNLALGGIGLAGQGINSYYGYKGQKLANETNLKLAEQSRQHDVDMWNKQNDYNTPTAQMARLQDAGLNPRLIYGSGQASAGNAQQPHKAPVAEVQNELESIKALNLLPIISQYQDWQVKKAQIDNLEAQRNVYQENAIGQALSNHFQQSRQPFYDQLAQAESYLAQGRGELQRWQANKAKRDFEIFDKYGMELSKHQLEGTKLMNRQRQLEIDLDSMLKPYGMHKGDELWQRLLLPILSKNFGDIRNFSFKKMFNYFK